LIQDFISASLGGPVRAAEMTKNTTVKAFWSVVMRTSLRPASVYFGSLSSASQSFASGAAVGDVGGLHKLIETPMALLLPGSIFITPARPVERQVGGQ
jgi:hypothetical protein